MPKKKLNEAMKVGDDFLKDRISSGFHFKINALLAVIFILEVMLVYDAIDLLLLHLVYAPHHPISAFLSVSEIFAVLILGLIAYKFARDLHEWEYTYKRVRKILS
jgi:hypothetical protein